jgi:hypothetical protein
MLMMRKNSKKVSAQFFVEVFSLGRKTKKNSLKSEFF